MVEIVHTKAKIKRKEADKIKTKGKKETRKEQHTCILNKVVGIMQKDPRQRRRREGTRGKHGS